MERTVSGHHRIGLAAVALLLAVAAVLVVGQRPASAATGDIRMHDPSVIKVGSCFYGFSTGFEGGPGGGAVTIRKTCDATLYGGWTYVGTVWNSPPAWITRRLGQTPPNFWAPDINYFNGRYHLYYAASIWGQSTAAMGLLTATNIEGPWTDAGEVTNVNYPIDANIAWSGSTPYVMWGSFRGIYLHVLDAANGKLSTTNHNLWRLASNIENATISFNGGYFYLFGSRGSCCIGVRSSYYTVVGRSTSISGPYLDRNGVDLANGGGTTIMTGSGTQVAAGGGDVFADGATTRLAYHFYDATTNGLETLNIRTVSYSGGWPTVSGPVGANAVPSFRLTNVNSGLVAEVAARSVTDGGDVVQWGWNGGTNQQWQFQDAGGGYSRVVNRNSGKCLDVSNGSTAEGADVLQWACGTGTNQQWRLVPVGRNFQLVARHSGRCLNVLAGSTADAANIVQSGCSNSANSMLWTRQ